MSEPIIDAATLRSYIKKLNAAIATGARQVTLGGQTVTFNTTESLIKARNDFQKQLAALGPSGGAKPSRQSYAVYGGRGY